MQTNTKRNKFKLRELERKDKFLLNKIEGEEDVEKCLDLIRERNALTVKIDAEKFFCEGDVGKHAYKASTLTIPKRK
jgi:hypothetical protein